MKDTNDTMTAELAHLTSGIPGPTTAPAASDNGAAKVKRSSPVAEFSMIEPPNEVDPWLTTILSYPRGHGSAGETEFLLWLQAILCTLGHVPTVRSGETITVEIPNTNGIKPTTLFACHVDTVDWDGQFKWKGSEPKASHGPVERKKLVYDNNFGHIFLAGDNKVGSCLGADDGVGVWILLKLIEAGVPGGYVFNRNEEQGAHGAKAMATHEKEWLGQFDLCIEFDRPGHDEVITHQRGGTRCASDKFGEALAKALNAKQPEFSYKVSSRGVFTDCYEWRGIIPECVNLAVGYLDQHGSQETLDYAHAEALMRACRTLDWDTLPVDREPVIETKYAKGYYSGFGGHLGMDDGGVDEEAYYEAWLKQRNGKAPAPPPAPVTPSPAPAPAAPQPLPEDDVLDCDVESVIAWCEGSPLDATATLFELATELKAMRSRVSVLRDLLAASRSGVH